jgi:hypothetical protein
LPMAARASSYCPAASSTQGGDWTRDEDRGSGSSGCGGRGSGSSGCGGRGAGDSGSSGSRPDLAVGARRRPRLGQLRLWGPWCRQLGQLKILAAVGPDGDND